MDPKWLGNGLLRELVMWELDLVEKRMNSQMVGYDDPKGILASVKRRLEHWESWCGHSVMGKRNKLILGNLMVEVKEIMAELEGV